MIDLTNVLLLDIETVSINENFSEMPVRMQELWKIKHKNLFQESDKLPSESFCEKAGIFAEFGKIVAIGLGFFYYNEDKELCIKVKVLSADNEKELLETFCKLLKEKFNSKSLMLCAHNGKEFDFPYLCRRLIINGLSLPSVLKIQGKKPWEIKHFDTLEMWKFGDWKSYTSLDLLAAVLGIESSKTNLDGSLVNEYYYQKKDFISITNYCAKDIVVLGQIFLSLNGINKVKNDNVFLS